MTESTPSFTLEKKILPDPVEQALTAGKYAYIYLDMLYERGGFNIVDLVAKINKTGIGKTPESLAPSQEAANRLFSIADFTEIVWRHGITSHKAYPDHLSNGKLIDSAEYDYRILSDAVWVRAKKLQSASRRNGKLEDEFFSVVHRLNGIENRVGLDIEKLQKK